MKQNSPGERAGRIAPPAVLSLVALLLLAPPAAASPLPRDGFGLSPGAARGHLLTQTGGAPYRYRVSPDRNAVLNPSAPYYHYEPRVILPNVPETRIERRPPRVRLRRPGAADEARGTRRTECRLLAQPVRPGSRVTMYGTRRDCD